MRVLLITPPLLQFNAPYPATAVLAADLLAHGFDVHQADLSLALALDLFSAASLRALAARLRRTRADRSPAVAWFLRTDAECIATVEAAVRFLQGGDSTLAHRIASRDLLPEGPRGAALDALPPPDPRDWQVQDRAKHVASLFLDDLADAIREGADARFGLARYAERLAVSAPTFAPLAAALAAPPSWVDARLDRLTDAVVAQHRPRLVGLTVPFPGTLYGALRVARRIRARLPRCAIALGGGYVSTELREMNEPRLFDGCDYVILDAGEEPLRRIAAALAAGRRPARDRLLRTFHRWRGRVVYEAGRADPPTRRPRAAPPPAYTQLPLDRYVSMIEMANPMHRLWSDGCWLKLPLAQGCYWHRCRFCDLALDGIRAYQPPRIEEVVTNLATLVAQTGRTGFHFTDEALAPGLLRRLSEAILTRGLALSWWGNVRFERGFTPELARLMTSAGCVAVSGGLECAHDRLLALMQKGITRREAAAACRAFAAAGMRVHAYLMYGFPTQTADEAVDALAFVRRLFAAGVLHSGYWHRFALTRHSPIAQTPDAYGIRLLPPPPGNFAHNEIPYAEPGAPDWSRIGPELHRATFNDMLACVPEITLPAQRPARAARGCRQCPPPAAR